MFFQKNGTYTQGLYFLVMHAFESVDQQLKRAAAGQDFFVSPLSHLCNGIGSSLRSGHAMSGACHHMSTSKFLKSKAAGEVHMQSHSPPQLALELQKFSHKNMAL
jgi:hypothetical protein